MEIKNTPQPWTYRKMRTHFAIEAANNVRVAEVRYHIRPDGSSSEQVAMLISELPNIVKALEDMAQQSFPATSPAARFATSVLKRIGARLPTPLGAA